MQTNFYTMDEISFVGGTTQNIYFNLTTPSGGIFNAANCSANFSLIDYSNKTGTPILSLSGEIKTDAGGNSSIVYVKIPATSTCSMYGKYIYQLQIKDINSNVDIPNQGLMYITKNINQSFITG